MQNSFLRIFNIDIFQDAGKIITCLTNKISNMEINFIFYMTNIFYFFYI